MKWHIRQGEILDQPGDVLVCSANAYLNLSGGVGGAFTMRYGRAMQDELRRFLATRSSNFVEPGEVVTTPPCGSPYQSVLHAVAVDAFYQTSAELVRRTILRSLETAAAIPAQSVVLAALGTGYGRLSMIEFAKAIQPLLEQEIAPLREVTVCVRNPHDAAELRVLIPTIQR